MTFVSQQTQVLSTPAATSEDSSDVPDALMELNRIYLQQVTSRALLTPAEAVAWLDQPVTVFLRHDRVRVFAIVRDRSVAMADFVTLTDVEFHVNQAGRMQSNQMQGPLPNRRTVHAWLTGRLLDIAESGQLPNPRKWQPVVYNPAQMNCFQLGESSQAVFRCSEVRMVPGRCKVWCPRETDPGVCCESVGCHS